MKRLWYLLLHVASPVPGHRGLEEPTQTLTFFSNDIFHSETWNSKKKKQQHKNTTTKNRTVEVLLHAQKQNPNVLMASHCFALRTFWSSLGARQSCRGSSAGVSLNIWWLARQRSEVRSCPRRRLPSVCLIGGRHSYKLRSCFHLSA